MALSDMRVREQKLNGENTDPISIISTDGAIADVTSSLQNMPKQRGVMLTIKLANKAGTVGFTPNIRIRDAEGNAVVVWTAAAELTANNTYVYIIHPEAPASAPATIKEAKIMCLPRVWDLLMDLTTGAGAGNSFDIDASVSFLM